MEECNSENNTNKRARDDSQLGPDSPESKRVRNDSEINSSELKQLEELEINSAESTDLNSGDSQLDSTETERVRSDILDILDDDPDNDPEIQDLDTFIKSFEEEILHPTPLPPASESGESQPELGYLLEASDDELGLPPAVSPSGEHPQNETSSSETAVPKDVGLANMLGFEDGLQNYDSFVFGIGEGTEGNNENGEFVTLDGLFDYADFSWQAESLPAL
ncbi:unnamed protein product [Ilex paraguariensis]|uniref:Uncharacterized protein n=1 Tax=Ilex paraguariensis TaxID=185542 RepID=A0ABC8RYD9_9AQUA